MTKTATELRARAAATDTEVAASWERCDTDGFLSHWAGGLTAALDRRNADLLDAGGVAEFPALFTVDGEWVPAKIIDTRFGLRWMVLDATGKATGVFLPVAPKRRSTLATKGFTEGRVVRPAVAVLRGNGGRGLSGATSVRVVTVPTTKEWEAPLGIVTRDVHAEVAR